MIHAVTIGIKKKKSIKYIVHLTNYPKETNMRDYIGMVSLKVRKRRSLLGRIHTVLNTISDIYAIIEQYLLSLVAEARISAMYAKRPYLTPKDIYLAQHLRGESVSTG